MGGWPGTRGQLAILKIDHNNGGRLQSQSTYTYQQLGYSQVGLSWVDFVPDSILSSESTPSPVSAPVDPVPSLGSVTITNKEGLNRWWYAVTLSVPSGVTVTKLMMKDSTMSSWEEGVPEWIYYKFTGHTPYTAPFHFKVITSSGQEYTGYNVITSINAGDSGEVTLSSAYTAESEGANTTEGIPSVEVGVIVGCSVLACCLLIALYVPIYILCQRHTKQVTAEKVEDEDVVMQMDGGYDMTTIGKDIQQNNDGVQMNETETMIEVQITETKE